jgi:endonuclease/exonuclease/phosphatase family metal-dependent hydrolase
VHLKCCDDGVATRAHQTKLLADWLKKTGAPLILLGDTNIPIEPGQHSDDVTAAAFRNLLDGASLAWIEPENPSKTQCNPIYDSMLDQVYRTSNLPVSAAAAEIMFPEASYCDGDKAGYSDHRPVVATFEFP